MNDRIIEKTIEWFEHEIQSLRKEITTRNETIHSLEGLIKELKNYENLEQFKEKFDETKKKYEQEKNHIQKLEKERDDLRLEIQTWQDWFDSNKELFDRLLNAVPPTAHSKKNEENKQIPVKLPKIKIKR